MLFGTYPGGAPVPSTIVGVPLAILPDLVRRAVDTVPRAFLLELEPDHAIVGRRTNFAIRSEVTRFAFRRVDDSVSAIDVVSSSGGASGFVRFNGILLETGKLILAAVVAEARADGV
jgi:hypothetical protein